MVLRGKEVVPATREEWNAMWEDPRLRYVAYTTLKPITNRIFFKDVVVSTVFLGLDHGYDGVPKWFETMVFNHPSGNDWTTRYTTYDEAVEGHERIVSMLQVPPPYKGGPR